MDSLPLCTTSSTSTANSFSTEFSLPCLPQSRRSRNLTFAKRPRNFLVFATKDEPPKLDQWDQTELKFGKMPGEDPKLTLAKMMVRKSNPDISCLEIEKSFQKKKGKGMSNDIEELPFDVSGERKSASSLNGLNLVRPVPKKGVKFQSSEQSIEKKDQRSRQPVTKTVDSSQGSVLNVILRKPSLFNDNGSETYSRFNMRPNLSLKMGKEREKKSFSDITLLKKPERLNENSGLEGENGKSSGTSAGSDCEPDEENIKKSTLVPKPELPSRRSHNDEDQDTPDESLDSRQIEIWKENKSIKGLQPTDISSSGKSFSLNVPSAKESSSDIHVDASLLGKPKRLDESVMGKANGGEDEVAINRKSYDNGLDLENFLSSPIKEHEETDWRKVEYLVKSGERADVEVISTSTIGFTVSFGSLIGFLPYRNLAAKQRFLAFEPWLRRRGIDPSKFKQSLGVIGSFATVGTVPTIESRLVPEFDHKFDGKISPDMKLEDLLRIYDQEKLQFLSSFVGQKIKAIVMLADRRSRQLIFSVRPKEKEELVEKKRNLMGKLSVGDVVKCCIKKITYFGILVEVEEVPAMIRQTEVSWDATLDLAAYFKVGQILEAKVHQLDFSLERIFLSLKEVTPDPLVEALEAVIGDHDSLNGRLEAAQADTEWAEVESLIKELEQVEGIQSVSKGSYFLSPGLAPTFQVYMALMFKNQYKLLARSGNRAQEVIVKTMLAEEEFKSAILTCTNRVQ